jgi:hypothetical protein
MIPDPSKAPLAQRLWHDMAAQLATRLGCCPIHIGTRLICALCDVQWTALAAEQAETEALLQRTPLYHLRWPTWPCTRCDTQDIALCVDCYDPVADQAFAGLTPEEDERLKALLSRSCRFTFMPDPDAIGNGDPSHERGSIP